jgi:FKBP-type peptidyl-prolyl cis-trans isomerase FkpA
MTFDPTYPSRRALLLGLAASVSAAACGGSSSTAPTQTDQTWVANVPFTTTDLTAGTGDEVVAGLNLSVDYFGWLYSTATTDNKGSLFDTSCPSTCTPIQFVVGSGRLIRGFEQGVLGMRIGGIRRVTIPPDLAYGATGSGSAIPPNATIIFEIRANGIVVSAT